VLPIRSIFCGLNGYRIYDIRKTCDYFQIDLAAKRRTALCPRCRRASPSIHSRYIRTLVHVPITLTTVRICLLTRRFRCRNPFCDQRIFAERAEDLGRPYARTTESNRTALQRIGGIAGSNPGQRIAKDIGIPTSACSVWTTGPGVRDAGMELFCATLRPDGLSTCFLIEAPIRFPRG